MPYGPARATVSTTRQILQPEVVETSCLESIPNKTTMHIVPNLQHTKNSTSQLPS